MRPLVVIACILFAALEAVADDYQAEWENLHAALLKESVDGDLDGALEIFEKLAGRLSASNETGPILAEALFQLGYGYAKRGDYELARIKLRECIRVSSSERCRHILSKIALQENAIKALPVRWEFETREHSFVLLPGIGTVQVETTDTSSHLKWVLPPGTNPDVLVLSVGNAATPPKRVRFEASLERGARFVYPVVEDRLGRRFTLKRGPLLLDTNSRVYEFSFREFVGIDQPSKTLDTNSFYRLELHERHAKDSSEQGLSALLIRWFEVL